MPMNQEGLSARTSLLGPRTFFPMAMRAGNDRDDNRTQNDVAGRAALELRVGRALTDAEWAAARARLVEFVSILRGWEQKTTASRRGNVEVLCQREP
jgi:hypothetical protein